MAVGEEERLRGGNGEDGGRRQELFYRSERKETKSPAVAFIERTHHGHNAHDRAEC